MSDTLIGLIVVISGCAMLWCARSYIEVNVEVTEWQRGRFLERYPQRRRTARYLFSVFPRAGLAGAYLFGVAVIVGGVVVFWL